jgi:diphthamide synthase subunit DPH2
MNRKDLLVIENIINNDITNETTRYGNSVAKYISKPIILADGQDAEDLLVYITGYRPNGTDLVVYSRLLNAEDSDKLENKAWTLMDNQSTELYSSTLNTTDYKEFVYKIPATAATATSAFTNATNFNIVQYSDTSNAVFVGFKQFAVKIIMTSTEKNIVPIINDVRVLGLQI